MEQHRTRAPDRDSHRDARRDGRQDTPPLPPRPGPDRSRHEPRPGPDPRGPAPLPRWRAPNPRLTGLGAGLFGSALMFLLGGLDQLLFGASLTVYGVLFLPLCLLTALWVRAADLLSAPVVAPIAFSVGLLPVAGGGNGAGARLMGLVTALATQVGWLYGGTLLAALTVLARGLRRAAAGRRNPARRPPSRRDPS
ncbi:DUF6542 domain-containing protein [Streptomyces sp. NBC_00199]|uniref:DUF6542 domain-containing protein n=1 Tax=Streptomyces sp. NBC_00199 TaxID=2975678 RepID=UPI0022599290|nr:DUF6542 domain-containing protein [Streptomyces sp. NBC_00199]MCX5266982.1 hypothetical protein [Streptomyces sp. NBC_00199]